MRNFRSEGFYERFPAKGQIERVARIHRELAKIAHIEAARQGTRVAPLARLVRSFILALTVCAAALAADGARAQHAIYYHLGTGRYVEAEKAGEERIKSPADRTMRNLAPLCTVYYKLRRYNKLADCINQLEARVAAGTTCTATRCPGIQCGGAAAHLRRACCSSSASRPARSRRGKSRFPGSGPARVRGASIPKASISSSCCR